LKPLVQAFLIGGGIIGFLIAAPISFFVWKMRGALGPDERGFLLMTCFGLPGLCIAAVVVGLVWKKNESLPPREPRE
jgi:hypothetical protein